MSDSELVREFLADQKFMVVSTVREGGLPWAVPVRILRHEDKVFEWDSAMSTEHSQAIEHDPDVMLLCFDTATQTGVYMQAEVTNIERRDDGFARYRVEAKRVWLNDKTFVKREVAW